ncbi:hypothetical protein MLD38_006802 [Melastoma candidum]|uniref:Uncharacterized protein n=1 Tax=Melastoma candidum TaxID=119954 RepID=A0ACB9RP66_9MYRT|nr:hypothetical protein MLD38_006802 [Melastoma candidum]
MHHLRASCSSASARAVFCVLGKPMMEGLDLILTEKGWGWDWSEETPLVMGENVEVKVGGKPTVAAGW